MDFAFLKAAPFDLDEAAAAWVETTLQSMTLDEKVGQIVVPLCRDLSPAALDRYLDLKVGGIHRLSSRSTPDLRASADYLQPRSGIPMIFTADLDFSEKNSLLDGTKMTNQMGIAATGKPEWAEVMAELCAEEMTATGSHWSFSPVVDLDLNHRSSIVNTRAFSSNPAQVMELTEHYIRAAQAKGVAVCSKHWPGDGTDDRDQHYVTTDNRLPLEAWRQSFGAVFQNAIDAGVKTIMAGHITLRSYSQAKVSARKSPEYMPATLNADLLQDLLRGELGFNGLIVSDSAQMAGFTGKGPRSEIVPMCIENGCDVLLFPHEPIEDDIAHLVKGVETGLLTMVRLDEAVARMLALKASVGLHLKIGDSSGWWAGDTSTEKHQQWAKAAAQASITLVKDTQGLMPLDAVKHKRLLVLTARERFSPSGPLPPLQISAMLRDKGFEVVEYIPGSDMPFTGFDAALYILADEGMSGKYQLSPRWDALHGAFPAGLERLWHILPTAILSLGSPYHLYDAPDCRTLVNAYSPVLPVQRALVDAITGVNPFTGRSPVDPFCGLPEAQTS
jgi:beta-N-acetylhexosaminidase